MIEVLKTILRKRKLKAKKNIIITSHVNYFRL